MLTSKYYKRWTIILTLILIVNVLIPFQNLIAQDLNGYQLIKDPQLKKAVDKLSSDSAARDAFTKFASQLGYENDILSFVDNLTGGNYVQELSVIEDVHPVVWTSYTPSGTYKIKDVKSFIRQGKPTTARIAKAGGYIMMGLQALSICTDIYDGINGNDQSKLKAIAGTESLVRGYIINNFGGAGMNLAMASTAIISYALNKFIAQVHGSYSDYWWQAYSSYLNKKYPKMVKGRNSWYNISKNRETGPANLNKRLYEFWDNAEQNARDYKGTPGIFDKESYYAYNNYRHDFAARYYKDYIHETLKTKFEREANKVRLRASGDLQKKLDENKKLLDNIINLKDAIEVAEKLLEIDKITVTPQEKTLKIGESVSFKVIAINKAGQKKDVTQEALSSTKFTAEDEGTFPVTASYLGKSATSTINVAESKCKENEKWNEEEGSCGCKDGFEPNKKGNCVEVEKCKDGFERNKDGICIKIEKCGENESWDAWEGTCECKDGFARNDKNKCVSESSDNICSIEYISSRVSTMKMLIAENKSNEPVLLSYINKFNKEINDKSSDPCANSIIAYSYYNALAIAGRMDANVSEIHSMSTEIIGLQAMCPGLGQQMASRGITIQSIISNIFGLGSYKNKIPQMAMRLNENGCDEDEIKDIGEKIVPPEEDPGFVQDGGTSTEMPGDGDDNDGDGQQDEEVQGLTGYNVTLVLYDSGSAADDVFSLSIGGYGNLGQTPAGGLRSYGLNLLPGSYTATVTVVLAPDDVGTYTLSVLFNGNSIGSLSGSPAQGASATLSFTVPTE